MPNRIHLKYKGMHIRSIIAILDHNWNINKNELGEKMVYSKPAGIGVGTDRNLFRGIVK